MDDIHKLIILAQDGDKKALDDLVDSNIGLVWSIVKKFMGRGVDTDDLFQLGAMGLVKAIKKFDISYDVKLSTYAVPMICGEIKRFLRDDGIIKISRGIKETAFKIMKAKESLYIENDREPTIEEISQFINIPTEDIVIALNSMRDIDSIDRKIETDKGNEMYVIDTIPNNNNKSEDIIDDIVLKQSLNTLEADERQIITMRYIAEMTQSQVAKKIGVSQVQVSRLEKKILKKLRKCFDE